MDYMAAQMDRQIEGAQHRYDAAIEDGLKPAFPVASYDHHTFQPANVSEAKRLLSGMSLRDYFAAKALQGLLAWPGDEGSGSYHSNSDPSHTASMAYEYADAMLAARSA